MKLANVLIVSFNAYKELVKCLHFLSEDLERINILVFDNNSEQKLKNLLRHLEMIYFFDSPYNLGFTKATNLLLRIIENDTIPYIVFLNPDCFIITKNWIEVAASFFKENSSAGLLTPKILYPNGVLQSAGAVISGQGVGIHRGCGESRGSYNEVWESEYATFSFAILKHEVFKRVGLLNENYPHYGSDVDYGQRVREQGYKVLYCPQIEAVHVEHASSKV